MSDEHIDIKSGNLFILDVNERKALRRNFAYQQYASQLMLKIALCVGHNIFQNMEFAESDVDHPEIVQQLLLRAASVDVMFDHYCDDISRAALTFPPHNEIYSNTENRKLCWDYLKPQSHKGRTLNTDMLDELLKDITNGEIHPYRPMFLTSVPDFHCLHITVFKFIKEWISDLCHRLEINGVEKLSHRAALLAVCGNLESKYEHWCEHNDGTVIDFMKWHHDVKRVPLIMQIWSLADSGIIRVYEARYVMLKNFIERSQNRPRQVWSNYTLLKAESCEKDKPDIIKLMLQTQAIRHHKIGHHTMGKNYILLSIPLTTKSSKIYPYHLVYDSYNCYVECVETNNTDTITPMFG